MNKIVPKELAGSYIQCILTVNLVFYMLCSLTATPFSMFQVLLNVLIGDAWWWRKYLMSLKK